MYIELRKVVITKCTVVLSDNQEVRTAEAFPPLIRLYEFICLINTHYARITAIFTFPLRKVTLRSNIRLAFFRNQTKKQFYTAAAWLRTNKDVWT